MRKIKKVHWLGIGGSLFVILGMVFFFSSFLQPQEIIISLPHQTNAKITSEYMNEKDLMEKAPYIVEGEVTDISTPFDDGGIEYVKITFQVDEHIYVQDSLEDTVMILRENQMFTPLKKQHRYLLYLENVQNSSKKSLKAVCGGNFGAYEIIAQDHQHQNARLLKDYKKTIQSVKNQ